MNLDFHYKNLETWVITTSEFSRVAKAESAQVKRRMPKYKLRLVDAYDFLHEFEVYNPKLTPLSAFDLSTLAKKGSDDLL